MNLIREIFFSSDGRWMRHRNYPDRGRAAYGWMVLGRKSNGRQNRPEEAKEGT